MSDEAQRPREWVDLDADGDVLRAQVGFLIERLAMIEDLVNKPDMGDKWRSIAGTFDHYGVEQVGELIELLDAVEGSERVDADQRERVGRYRKRITEVRDAFYPKAD